MKAVLRTVRISPKKANLVAGAVRNKKVSEALEILEVMPKKGARILYKVVHSAAHNAKNNFKQSIDDLFITKILVTKGPTLKRSLPISRGRTHPIRKRTSHITVEVGQPESLASAQPEKSVEKEVAKKAAPKKAVAKKTTEKKAAEKASKETK